MKEDKWLCYQFVSPQGAIAYAAPAVAAAPALTTYAGYAAVPAVPAVAALPALVAHPNGAVVPVDEPAVQEARAAHLAALASSH